MDKIEENTFDGESLFETGEVEKKPEGIKEDFTIEEMMMAKLNQLVSDRQNFMTDLSQFIHKKGTSNKRVLKIVQYGLFRNTDFRDTPQLKLKPGNESALGEKLRNLMDDEMTIGHLQFALASQQDDLINETNPQMEDQQDEIKEKGIDIPDYAKN